MEFVGDAFLNCVVGATLFERFPRCQKVICLACGPVWSTRKR
jgi:hypothetical protein